ncbi:S1 RNA-binding domain-containing protein [Streptomyces canus]|uniref:Ribosomal protein S1 n=1 Tax=Streptomyces canus TaxID=58343 RepID=A0AAW8FI90_9ACTN|nr:S1 RNA-binding domain-containing protein [Streptomyces canus]MDQ0762818.1 ribosomal protein S1 [Streptomyces canus]MDQ0908725.1 ribosomal protein S1 [Streptomyces canus]MDQ1068724.1 ribosomal protein S1 [Streptomyces canus]
MTNTEVSAAEMRLVGSIVEGEATAVFRWGVIVDLGLSRDGLIDVLYIDDDDNYQVGDRVSCYLDCFDEMKNKFILRPPGQVPLAERLRRAQERRDLSS